MAVGAGSVNVIEHLRPHPLSASWYDINNPNPCKIALLATFYILIACFPTAAVILIKKYIWVGIWIAKCDLRPLDFAQKSPQTVEMPFPRTKVQTFSEEDMSPEPLEICRHFGLTFFGRQISVGLPS